MNFKIYKSKSELCKICKEKEALLLPICIIEEKTQTFPVCADCVDKIPYQKVPVTTTIDNGYFFFPKNPKNASHTQHKIDEDIVE